MEILVVHPAADIADAYIAATGDYLASLLSPDTHLRHISLRLGFPVVESELHGLINGAQLLGEVSAALQSETDGVLVNCFDDPAVGALREMLEIPVFGAYEASVLTAVSLSGRVGIITTDSAGILNEERKLRALGLEKRIAAIEAIDMDVSEVFGSDRLVLRLADACQNLSEQHHIGAAVLGCTGMQRVAEQLKAELSERNCRISVVEPLATAALWLERTIKLGLTNSAGLGLKLPDLFLPGKRSAR